MFERSYVSDSKTEEAYLFNTGRFVKYIIVKVFLSDWYRIFRSHIIQLVRAVLSCPIVQKFGFLISAIGPRKYRVERIK